MATAVRKPETVTQWRRLYAVYKAQANRYSDIEDELFGLYDRRDRAPFLTRWWYQLRARRLEKALDEFDQVHDPIEKALELPDPSVLRDDTQPKDTNNG